jgi:hypothetical protein
MSGVSAEIVRTARRRYPKGHPSWPRGDDEDDLPSPYATRMNKCTDEPRDGVGVPRDGVSNQGFLRQMKMNRTSNMSFFIGAYSSTQVWSSPRVLIRAPSLKLLLHASSEVQQ